MAAVAFLPSVVVSTPSWAVLDDEYMGVLAPQMAQHAPAKTAEWGKLVGEWAIKLDQFDEEGSVSASYDGEWNFFYTLGGVAIQDIFVLPPRNAEISPESRFYGTGIRIFDAEEDQWRIVWIDTGGKEFELRKAHSDSEKIIMFADTENGPRRWTYYDMTANSFRWKQEIQIDNIWTIEQAILATKTD